MNRHTSPFHSIRQLIQMKLARTMLPDPAITTASPKPSQKRALEPT